MDRRARTEEDGFTLIELMAVVLIIAVLVAVAIPAMNAAWRKSKDRAVQADVQTALKAEPDLASRVQLLSVSFDPEFDTPDVLKAHAARVGADPSLWSYVTGPREGIDAFAAAFGVTVMREDGTMEEIIHNLRTAVIGPDGRLVEVFNGNDWQPAQLVASIRATDAGR